ncbi:YncE family protein [Nocardia australiensis]|uniref:YncE family protein n=1 Tax=Nocardia australiensis TaxID=2887191 RepID=UPI001D14B7AB|nr:hypothetical protein [Nocardia australiensis]
MRPRGSVSSAIAGVAALVLLVGCSSDKGTAVAPTRDPATAAVAPGMSTPPGGEVFALAKPIGGLLAESGTGKLVALDAGGALMIIDPATLTRIGPSGTPNPDLRTVALPAPAAAIAQGAPGEILVPAQGRVIRVDIATGAISEVPVEGDVRSVQRREDGDLVVGTADGKVRIITAGGDVRDSVSGLASADALAMVEDRIAVLDRRQTSLTEIDTDKDRIGLSLRAGDGATNMISDHYGRVIITDTAGNELLVYTTGPLVLRQRFPVASSPYALAYDQRSDTVWVTCTQSNEVVGFDLSTGMPKEIGRYPTVRQPNSVTVDEHTGDLFVGSATGDGLQRIRADQRKRGQ